MKRKIAHFIISVFAVMMTIIVITPVIMTIVMSFRNGWETYVDLAIWEPAYTHAHVELDNNIICRVGGKYCHRDTGGICVR